MAELERSSTMSKITRITAITHANVPLPAGAALADIWEGDDPQRVIMGPNRGITDSDVIVWTTAIQSAGGRIYDGPEPPLVHIHGDPELNSDQARELAAVLLEVGRRAVPSDRRFQPGRTVQTARTLTCRTPGVASQMRPLGARARKRNDHDFQHRRQRSRPTGYGRR
jgi:hypothetical protein